MWERGHRQTVRRVSNSYRGGQRKLLRSGSLWLLPTVVENKNITEKLSFFFHRPAGGDFDRENEEHFHNFPAIEIIETTEC